MRLSVSTAIVRSFAVMAVAFAFVLVRPATAAPAYTITDLGPYFGFGINAAGQVVGSVAAPDGSNPIASIDASLGPNPGTAPLPGGFGVAPVDINASGQVAGTRILPSGHEEAVVLGQGQATGLGTLPGTQDSFATRINNAGQVTGFATTTGSSAIPVPAGAGGNSPGPGAGGSSPAGLTRQPFLVTGGKMVPIGNLPGFNDSFPAGINAAGQVVGTADNFGLGSGSRAFLYTPSPAPAGATSGGGSSAIAATSGATSTAGAPSTSSTNAAAAPQVLGYAGGGSTTSTTTTGTASVTGASQTPTNAAGGTVTNQGGLGSGATSTPAAAGATTVASGPATNLGASTAAPQTLGASGGAASTTPMATSGGTTAGASSATTPSASGGTLQNLGTLGGNSSSASAINNAGQVVGTSQTSGGNLNAFLFSNGVMQSLGVLPGGTYSDARAINANGDAVGASNTGSDPTLHATLFTQGKVIDLNELIPPQTGWTLNTADAISDTGQILGMGTDPKGRVSEYLLTPSDVPDPAPVPEPGTLASFGVLAVGLAVRAVRGSGRSWFVVRGSRRGRAVGLGVAESGSSP